MKYGWMTVAAATALVGCGRSYERDVDEVTARYGHKVEDCSSWLKSHRTGYPYCASPAFQVDVLASRVVPLVQQQTGSAAEVTGPTDLESLKTKGGELYGNICVTCHKADGNGDPGAGYPPLAGAGTFYGDARNHSRIVVHGLQGEIQVNGATFNGVMPPHGHLSNYEIAAILTYVRHSWGNNDGIVTPEDVAAVR